MRDRTGSAGSSDFRCFSLLSIINKEFMNIHMQVLCGHVPFVFVLRSETAATYSNCCQPFEE